MAEENYMDKFSRPEEFIRQQILAKGNFSSLDKKEMYRLIRDNNIEFQIHKSGLAYTKKQDMLHHWHSLQFWIAKSNSLPS